MGGRKKLVQNTNANNAKHTPNDDNTSEMSGRDPGNSPQLDSMQRPAVKQHKFKKLGT
jgi:hypothetical protein